MAADGLPPVDPDPGKQSKLESANVQPDVRHWPAGTSEGENHGVMGCPDVLEAGRGDEVDFEVADNPFAFNPGQLNKMFNPKSLAAFRRLGGLAGLEKGLRTDREAGLSLDEDQLAGAVSFEEAVGRESSKFKHGKIEIPQTIADQLCTPSRSSHGQSLQAPAGDTARCSPRIGVAGHFLQYIQLLVMFWVQLLSRLCRTSGRIPTQDRMQVVSGSIGATDGFEIGSKPEKSQHSAEGYTNMLSKEVRDLLQRSISLNSTAFESETDGVKTFIGSKTEVAMLNFAREHLGMGSVYEERAGHEILQVFPFDSNLKYMGILVRLGNGKQRLYVKGAPEPLLNKCTKFLNDPTKDLTAASLTREKIGPIRSLVEAYLSRSLRPIAIAYRDMDVSPSQWDENGRVEVPCRSIFRDMTYIGVMGIQDPAKRGKLSSGHESRKAKILVRLVGSDSTLRRSLIGLTMASKDAHGVQKRSFLPILVDGQMERALPDTEAVCNVVTEAYAASRGATINRDPRKQRTFTNAIGQKFRSSGIAEFGVSLMEDPTRIRKSTFAVLDRCAEPLVLGSSFLKEHQIFTKFGYSHNLIKASSRSNHAGQIGAFRVMHMEASRQKLACVVDSRPALANADSGSEVDLVSLRYARSRRWAIHAIKRDDKGSVMLANEEIVPLAGYVEAKLSVEGTEIMKRFYVLKGLICDVLLGDATLESLDAFKQCRKSFVNLSRRHSRGSFCMIRWVEKFNRVEKDVDDILKNRHVAVNGRVREQSCWGRLLSIFSTKTPQPPKAATIDVKRQLRHRLDEVDSIEADCRALHARKTASLEGADLRREQELDKRRRERHAQLRHKILRCMQSVPAEENSRAAAGSLTS